MEEKRRVSSATHIGRAASNIPKPSSRLPLPRSGIPTPTAAGARPLSKPTTPASETTRPSTAQSSTTGSLQNSRLRPAASRERIKAPATLPRSYKSGVPAPISQTSTREPGTKDASPRPPQTQSPVDSVFKKPQIPRRQPPGQFGYSAQSSAKLTNNGSDEQLTNDLSELPPVDESAADSPTLDDVLVTPRKPTPSLSERTIETLSNLTTSPVAKSRGTNFFDAQDSKRPQSRGNAASRPGSSHQSDGSIGSFSRPGSSSSSLEIGYGNARASTNFYQPPLASIPGTPSKRISRIGSVTPQTKSTPKLTPRASLNNLSSRGSLSATVGPGPRTPSPARNSVSPGPKLSSTSLVSRPAKARGTINGLFAKPSLPMSANEKSDSDVPLASVKIQAPTPAKSFRTSGESLVVSSLSLASNKPTVFSPEEPPSSAQKSSSALRDQIAKAKAAKRAAAQVTANMTMSETAELPVISIDDAPDFGLSDDPFGQKKFEDSNRKVMQSRIEMARATGRLNIAAMGLKEIPEDVLKMYDLESIGGVDGSWAESVDLTRLVAADNELETIDDSIFPDVDPDAFDSEEVDDKGRIFWGLESADLHNNLLVSLPLGLRRLKNLTSLNLASNKLTNDCLEIIAQCTNLRELKLGNNLLSGPITSSLVIENLEILDLHGNTLSGLPSGIEKMKKLRILNLDENAFESLPFEILSALPLTDLHVRKNKLAGTLIGQGATSFPQLQILDCSGNQLSHLYAEDAQVPLHLPSLHQLSVSQNRLKSLPDMSGWDSILTIHADENSITTFPEGFTSRSSLRHVGLSGNDIRIVPPEIARMDSLFMLSITGNPLRDKKFTSLTTEELKDALSARLELLPGEEVGSMENFASGVYSTEANTTTPKFNAFAVPASYEHDVDEQSESDDFATPPTSAPHSPARQRSNTSSSQTWVVKSGGIIDRSETQSSSLQDIVCSKIAAAQTIREVRLQHNTFTQLPISLSFFSDTLTSLCLSHNQLSGDNWLTERLDLGALRELNLRSNLCTSLSPLVTHLSAPNLEKLDVSLNRIAQLPALREVFPSLTILLISNNRLEELDPDVIQGMKVVDASNNEIAHLHPRLGLLGLDRLDVMGNRFRVPRYTVLESGTEATLRWLRSRLPAAEIAEWRTNNGVTEDDSFDDVD